MKILFKILIGIILTVITQVGGLVLLFSLWICNYYKFRFKFNKALIFIGLYLISIFFIVPFMASFFGRESVIHNNKIKPTNYMTVLLNRNYVKPELNKLLLKTSNYLKGTAITIHYLDANFPFIDNFPLLPHLSHNDGKKLDISLIYETKTGKITNKQKSISGYGVFEHPKNKEYNQIDVCFKKGFFQYDYPKYVTFGRVNKSLMFSEKGTKKLIESLLKNKNLGKLFIEPHLKQRLNLTNKKIRYHGCQAVRHDDHIHIQL